MIALRSGAMALAVAAASHAGVTWHVDDSACPGPGSGAPDHPFCSIQDAIDAAAHGDVVLVAAGAYFQKIDLMGKAITVRGALGATQTLLDGSGPNVDPTVTCASGEGPLTVLEGITIANGESNAGGGMLNDGASPTVIDCVFDGNTAHWNDGGGMWNGNGASPTVIGCVFVGNRALGGSGGGVYSASGSSPTFIRCTFTRNLAFWGRGGGAFQGGSSSFRDCVFQGNTTEDGEGGGLFQAGGTLTLINCLFSGNAARLGSGPNGSPAHGGALLLMGAGASLINCTLVANSADGAGGGAWSQSGLAAGNSIVWGNLPDAMAGDAGADASHCDIEGGWPGPGNVSAAPAFARDPQAGPDGAWGTDDDDYGDLRLLAGSPCIDAADNALLPRDVGTDLDGNPRRVDDPAAPDAGSGSAPLADLGALERQPCAADASGDGLVDVVDLALVLTTWGGPGGAGDVTGDGAVDVQDLVLVVTAWGPCG
jgi:hypothetical protein